MQNQLYQGQQLSGIAMEKPVIPDPFETFGQGVLDDQK
jgi:hypothetical protein